MKQDKQNTLMYVSPLMIVIILLLRGWLQNCLKHDINYLFHGEGYERVGYYG